MYATVVKPNFRNAFPFPHFFNTLIEETHTQHFRPAVNISEQENHYVIDVVAPGLSKEDFDVKIEKDLLTISAKKENIVNEGEKQIRREFLFTQFERSFHLNEKIDAEQIAAHYENGILKLTLTKKEVQKPAVRNISIM
jgi:HSP20 family protein